MRVSKEWRSQRKAGGRWEVGGGWVKREDHLKIHFLATVATYLDAKGVWWHAYSSFLSALGLMVLVECELGKACNDTTSCTKVCTRCSVSFFFSRCPSPFCLIYGFKFVDETNIVT